MAGTFDYEKYQKDYRKKHPEKVAQWRNNTYVRWLLRHGYSIIAPDGKPCTLKEGVADA